MKEIKFRGWDRENNEMIYSDHEGGLQQFFNYTDNPTDFTTNDVEFMQYTGLKDKDGKEIYEEDIVAENSSIGIIKFKDAEFTIDWIVNKDFFNNTLLCHIKWLKIIGNIYTTPNILDGNFINERCPKCGSQLLKNSVGDKWCSLVDCDYYKEGE